MMIRLIQKNISFLQIILIIILGVLIYANCSSGSFVWDDHGLIKDNNYIKNWSNFTQIMGADFGAGGQTRSDFYRPLQTIVQMVGYSLWGSRTAGYHFINIFAHILAAVIFYFFLKNIFYERTIAFLASLLFLSSPINTEAVCYISGLSDPLSLIFMLTCLILYIKSLSSKNLGLYTLALLSFVLALFSKENAVALPLLILLYHYAFKKESDIRKLMPFFGILIGYLALRLTVLSPPENLALTLGDLWARIPIFFAGIAEYLRLLLLPFNLHVEYTHQLFRFTDAKVMFGLILTCALIISAFFMRRKAHPGYFFSIAWFFITLLPVSNIYPISQAFIMEHYLYVPALGFFIILSSLLCRPTKNRILTFSLRFFIIGLLIFYSYLTLKQTEYWKQPVNFYKRTLQYAPDSWRFYNELGIEYAGKGNNLEAQAAYKQALSINPQALGIYYNLENLYKKTNDQKSLLATLKTVNAIKAGLIWQYYQAASQLKDKGSYIQALAVFKRAWELDQNNLIVGSELASTYVLTGRYKDAVVLFREILRAKPDFALAYNNLAVAYYYLKQYDLAAENCDKAKALGYSVKPKFVNLLNLHKK
jgi:protein O-mannosyl-transferase